jgi:thiosulfate/3-mercaptopyruvate sulfurtransferase
MSFKVTSPLVSVDWLFGHLEEEKLIVLDCSIPKVTAKEVVKIETKEQIKGALFFNIKYVFSDKNAPIPNTVLAPIEFESKAQNLAIHQDSIIIVYDDLGIYSSPRVWWMFKLMGFKNVLVLNGGFPAWKAKNYPVEKPNKNSLPKGNFKAQFQSEKLKFTKDILSAVKNKNFLITDARSKGRFNATEAEPRAEIKRGHIPNSVSLPYSEVVENGFMKSRENLSRIYKNINPDNKDFIFSCGSGITASVLALGAEISGYTNHAVYDGSWTEWGSTNGLPIEK